MVNFNQTEFNEFITRQNVIGFFKEPVRLKSDRLSNWYVNWRNVTENVWLIDKLANYVIAFTKDQGLNPDCFYGVPEGATKLGIIAQYKWVKAEKLMSDICPLPMGRGKLKDHGDPKDRYFVGMPKGKTIILEDVTTTGGSLLTTIDNLLEVGIDVIAAIGLTNRNEKRDDGKSVKEAVKEKGVPYFAMSNALYLLPEACKRLQPGEDVAKDVEEYFERYGVEKIKLI